MLVMTGAWFSQVYSAWSSRAACAAEDLLEMYSSTCATCACTCTCERMILNALYICLYIYPYYTLPIDPSTFSQGVWGGFEAWRVQVPSEKVLGSLGSLIAFTHDLGKRTRTSSPRST